MGFVGLLPVRGHHEESWRGNSERGGWVKDGDGVFLICEAQEGVQLETKMQELDCGRGCGHFGLTAYFG